MEFGSFPVGSSPVLTFSGVAKKDGVVKVDNLGQTGSFRVFYIVSYTGKMVPSTMKSHGENLCPR